ncbi:sulfatase-like hydrolase/transferase [Acidobacteria bacterium AH-259-A15]|nr:sulfatase-like hydrolase/transferase [Acidobacteria bacterium AH-259-A15]
MAVIAVQTAAFQRQRELKPNILLIYADDLGYGDLGCFGSTEVKTPNLDRMASQGMRLTDFYVTAPICGPSRSGLLTGRYPQRNGLYSNIRNNMVNYDHRYKELEYVFSPEMTQGLDVREVTIAQVLKQAGYTTGIVGKWDSGRAWPFLPLQRGFDFFYGFANTGIDYWTHERYGIPSMFRGNERIKEEGYATNLFRREALRFIEENKERPFFLYVPFNAPHGPSNLERTGPQAPDEYIRMYAGLPTDRRTRYMANITCMDAAVGEILNKLTELGLDQNTLVIFTSDNGASTVGRNTPLRGSKGDMYEGGFRVPFIARWPGRIAKGKVSHEFCSTLDLFPAFLALAGVEPPEGLIVDGYNILPVLTDQAKSPRKEHFWELQGSRAARVGNWKWVLESPNWLAPPKDATGELFDLSADPSEEHDLAAKKPEVLKQLKARWESWMNEMANSEPRGPFSNTYFELLGFPR